MAKNSKNNTPQKYLNNMLVLPVVQHIAEDILKYNHWNRNDTTRGCHSHMLCTSIFVRGQDESQETNPNTLDSQKSSYLITGQKSNQF